MTASAGPGTALARRGLPALVLPETAADERRTERPPPPEKRSSPRPITFALPPLPSPRLASTSPQLTPSSEHANPFAGSPSSPSSGSGFLGRLGRKLSLGRRSSRRGAAASSERRKSRDVGESVSPALAAVSPAAEKENVDPVTSSQPARTGARVQLVDPGPTAPADGVPGSSTTTTARRRSLRVSSALLRRSKSEGSSPSTPAAAAPTAPARRRRSARRQQDRLWTEEEKYAELASRRRAERGEGEAGDGESAVARSYFWDEALGLCWDGREQVHPDLLSSTGAGHQPYTSDSDFLPPSAASPALPSRPALSSSHPPPPHSAHRIVYASTLSSFPPRPPLRQKEKELTPAEMVIKEYRDKWGWLTPSVRSFRLDSDAVADADSDGGRDDVDEPADEPADEGDLPTPTPSNPLSTQGFPPLSPPSAAPARALARLDPSPSSPASPASPTHASKASTASSSVPSERYGFAPSRRSRSRGGTRREGGTRASRDWSAGGGSETSHGTAGDDEEDDAASRVEGEDEDVAEKRRGERAVGLLAVPPQQERKMGGSFVTAREGAADDDDAVDDWQECQ